MSQFFVFPTCAAIDLSFSHYYSINLKSLLLNLRDRHLRASNNTFEGNFISDMSKPYSSECDN